MENIYVDTKISYLARCKTVSSKQNKTRLGLLWDI